MIGIFFIMSCILIIGAVTYSVLGIAILSQRDSDGFGLLLIALICFSFAFFVNDMDVTENKYYKIGTEQALTDLNSTEYENCVEYVKAFESDEWNELNNRSTYRYCRGYVASYENVLESKQLLQAERNLTFS